MLDQSLDDTIIAVSTPPGCGGIGVVRLSGKDALRIAKQIFRPHNLKIGFPARTAVLGHLYDGERDEFIDEGYLLYFPQPHSYTRENIVEISGHGSPAVMEEVLRIGIRAGARPAAPGEFTLRAYMRGRIDIIQAQAVNDLIRADSPQAARMAFDQIDGRLSLRISGLRRKIVELLSEIEASIEFPDEKLPVTSGTIGQALDALIEFLGGLVSSYEAGKAILEGVTLALIGRTNVGKSTLFNTILEAERAIVTPYAGTTRDYLIERIRIKDVSFNLVDMAGLGKPRSPIEEEGIRRGREIAARADGIIVLLDVSRKETREDHELLEQSRAKKALLVFNKIDLARKMDIAGIKKRFSRFPSLEISALQGTHLRDLKNKIYATFALRINEKDDVIFHLRQKLILEEALARLVKAKTHFVARKHEEICAEEIREVLPGLGRLTGEIRTEDVIEDVFSRFCVGK